MKKIMIILILTLAGCSEYAGTSRGQPRGLPHMLPDNSAMWENIERDRQERLQNDRIRTLENRVLFPPYR